MAGSISWRDAAQEVIATGLSASTPLHFDDAVRSAEVARRVSEARRYPIWPVIVAGLLLAVPDGWVFALIVGIIWGVAVRAAIQRGQALQIQLDAETIHLRESARRDAAQVTRALECANSSDIIGLQFLLGRWLSRRPECIRTFTAQITRDSAGSLTILGDAVRREALPLTVPRVGRGGRIVQDKRPATEVDEDLTELNALSVISLLLALVNVPTRQRLAVRIMMATDAGMIPWVTLYGDVGSRELQVILAELKSSPPSDVIRHLGGDVGQCRRQRLSPAHEPRSAIPRAESTASVRPPVVSHSRMNGGPPSMRATVSVSIALPGDASHATDGREVIPPPPPGLRVERNSDSAAAAAPTPATVQGQFSAVARRFVTYSGDPNARFADFETYWPTYARMTAGQLKFYFKWRHSARTGDHGRTDLSYIFVHIYELLHVIGASDAREAGKQIEALWLGYRSTFPKLDGYCVRWVTDLYAGEVDSGSAVAFIGRALEHGCAIGMDEAAIVTEQLWANGNYAAMPRASLATLTGDARLGDNKFHAQHNEDGWVDRAYREALRIADQTYSSKFGCTLRETTIKEHGVRAVAREPFSSAVYDWQRKPVVLGTVTKLAPEYTAVQVYRSAAAYTENLLRNEKGFRGRLRGVEVGPTLQPALDRFFADYIRSTRPRATVVIDLAKARRLAQESEAARARLLAGLDDQPTPEAVEPGVSATHASQSSRETPAEPIPAGLLTDLAPIEEAVAASPAETRAILNALVDGDWELNTSDARVTKAAGGALLSAIVADLNNRVRDRISGPLVVIEGDTVLVQDDYRDEVFWACRGTLSGFARGAKPTASESVPTPDSVTPVTTIDAQLHGFSLVEIQALELIFRGGAAVGSHLAALASANVTMPGLIIDRINEIGLSSPYGDLLVDASASPPALMEDAVPYVTALLGGNATATATTGGAS